MLLKLKVLWALSFLQNIIVKLIAAFLQSLWGFGQLELRPFPLCAIKSPSSFFPLHFWSVYIVFSSLSQEIGKLSSCSMRKTPPTSGSVWKLQHFSLLNACFLNLRIFIRSSWRRAVASVAIYFPMWWIVRQWSVCNDALRGTFKSFSISS